MDYIRARTQDAERLFWELDISIGNDCAEVASVAEDTNESRRRATRIQEREVTDERRHRPCQHESGAEGKRRARAGNFLIDVDSGLAIDRR